jgi:ribonucleoside-diphosphate reductase beta chain
MNGFVGFFSGEIDVTNMLGPFINAAPRLDQRVFLATQLVDEARHVVFFDKWFTEVLGKEGAIVGDQMSDIEQRPFGRYIFKQLLPEISRELSHHPDNLKLLVEGITLYHIIIEDALALAGQTRILQTYKQGGIFPGFQAGFTAVARDESRHVLFGVKFLREMVQSDDKYAHAIMDFINTRLPDMYLSGRPLPEMIAVYRKAGQDVDFTPKFYASSLRRHLRAVGIQANIPEPQPTHIPAESMAIAA